MELIRLSIKFNGYTYSIIGDPLNRDEMKESLVNEVLSRYGFFRNVTEDSIRTLIQEETISLGKIYTNDNQEGEN